MWDKVEGTDLQAHTATMKNAVSIAAWKIKPAHTDTLYHRGDEGPAKRL